jgi:hypothetical protein
VTTRKPKAKIPRKLYLIPIGLLISTPLFLCAWAVSASKYGRTASGAKLNFVFWSAGLIVEIVAHIRMSRQGWDRPWVQVWPWSWSWPWPRTRTENSRPRAPDEAPQAESMPELSKSSNHSPDRSNPIRLPIPRSDFSLRSRLEAITTIILGEVSQKPWPVDGKLGLM